MGYDNGGMSPRDARQMDLDNAARTKMRSIDLNQQIRELKSFIADDSIAATYQTMSQYRGEILRKLIRMNV